MSDECRWYVLKVVSNKEQIIGKEIEKLIDSGVFEGCVESVYVPVHNVTKIWRGKRITESKSIYSGYVMVNMVNNKTVATKIRSIDGVLGFVGGGSDRPTPLTPVEVKNMMECGEKVASSMTEKVVYEVGQVVKVIDGSFESFVGEIEHVDPERLRLRVMVMIFGRPTPVDLDWDQVDIDVSSSEN